MPLEIVARCVRAYLSRCWTASRRESVRAVVVVVAVGASDVAFMAKSAAAVSDLKKSKDVVMTGTKLGPSIMDTLMDIWKHCLDASDKIRASCGVSKIRQSRANIRGPYAYAVPTRCCAICRVRALVLSTLGGTDTHQSYYRVCPCVQKNAIS
jgi:hypothetical protein